MKYLSITFLLLIAGCNQPPPDQSVSELKESMNLWTDATSTYLPETAEWTNRAEAADINGDGMADILFANGGDYSTPGEKEAARVFLNQGPDQPFREITTEIFEENRFHSRVIKVMDLNKDSIPDIVVGTTFQSQSQLLIGQGEGKFINVTETNLPAIHLSVGDLEFGDADMDGDLDIVLADWGEGNNMTNAGGRTRLWLNDGQGRFTDATSTHMPDVLIRFSWDIEFLDLDNDFDLDLAISCKRCESSRLFENDGTGHFTVRRGLPAYTNNYEFESMDVNNDGWLDLVTVNDGDIVGSKNYSRKEHLFISDSGKFFTDATDQLWPAEANIGEDDNNIVFLDYDSDGDADFLLSSLTGEDRLLVNNGSGEFQLMQPVLHGNPTPHTLSLIIADINGDHKPDLIMGQGEGTDDLDERIFLGTNIPEDNAPPDIMNFAWTDNPDGSTSFRARIHDRKSPNMPQDWETVFLLSPDSTIQKMDWYGEYLWELRSEEAFEQERYRLCAIDAAGNSNCRYVNFKTR